MRAQFIASEIGIGLRRNLTMTIAVVVTTAISLALFGAGLLIRAQVGAMKDYWYNKVEVSIFLCNAESVSPNCTGPVTPAQRSAIYAALMSLKPLVAQVYYENQQQAFAHFEQQFKGTSIAQNVTAAAMPESFRVKLSNPKQYQVITDAFTGRPGVDQVQDQHAILDKFFKVLGGFQAAALFIALVEIVAAALLISNTIRVSAFSRRRETGIMRLVGASSFYIQLPFLLEGAIAGLIGGLIASGSLFAVKAYFVDAKLVPSFPFTNFIGWNAVWGTSAVVVVVGVLLSAIASLLTLRRFLRV
ncbi:MAG: permease-like cell division protein FtsX [Actinomycetes bacterium]